jgi:hypothetical protein
MAVFHTRYDLLSANEKTNKKNHENTNKNARIFYLAYPPTG